MEQSVKLWFLAVTITLILDRVESLKCYKCTILPAVRSNETERLCIKFDGSDRYIVDCPYSTMCMKRIYRLKLLNGEETETVSRDCAQQKSTEHVLVDRQWKQKVNIEEPYSEDCETFDGSSQYCHCRGNLCNGANKVDSTSYHTDAMAVIFVFNLVKYIRNMEY